MRARLCPARKAAAPSINPAAAPPVTMPASAPGAPAMTRDAAPCNSSRGTASSAAADAGALRHAGVPGVDGIRALSRSRVHCPGAQADEGRIRADQHANEPRLDGLHAGIRAVRDSDRELGRPIWLAASVDAHRPV